MKKLLYLENSLQGCFFLWLPFEADFFDDFRLLLRRLMLPLASFPLERRDFVPCELLRPCFFPDLRMVLLLLCLRDDFCELCDRLPEDFREAVEWWELALCL